MVKLHSPFKRRRKKASESPHGGNEGIVLTNEEVEEPKEETPNKTKKKSPFKHLRKKVRASIQRPKNEGVAETPKNEGVDETPEGETQPEDTSATIGWNFFSFTRPKNEGVDEAPNEDTQPEETLKKTGWKKVFSFTGPFEKTQKIATTVKEATGAMKESSKIICSAVRYIAVPLTCFVFLNYYPSFVNQIVEITNSSLHNETLSQIVASVLVGIIFILIIAATAYFLLTMARAAK